MRDRLIVAAGIGWGGFLLVHAYLRHGPAPLAGAQVLSLVFAALFVVGGAYYLFKPTKPAAKA